MSLKYLMLTLKYLMFLMMVKSNMINYFKTFDKKQGGMISKYELEFNIKTHMFAKTHKCTAVSIGCHNIPFAEFSDQFKEQIKLLNERYKSIGCHNVVVLDQFSDEFKEQIKLANEKYRNVDNLFCRIRNLLCDEGNSKLVKASRYKRLYNELINDIYEANNILEKHKDELNNLYRIYPIL